MELPEPCASREPQRASCRRHGNAGDGYAERDVALLLLHQRQKRRSERITMGADKACDTEDFVVTARQLNVTVHVRKNDNGRRSRVDRITIRPPGYVRSLSSR